LPTGSYCIGYLGEFIKLQKLKTHFLPIGRKFSYLSTDQSLYFGQNAPSGWASNTNQRQSGQKYEGKKEENIQENDEDTRQKKENIGKRRKNISKKGL
jgi:hypothetical protein